MKPVLGDNKPEKASKDGIYPVILAFLHQAITWPGVAGSEKTLSENKIRGIKMTHEPRGLVLKCKGQTCIVPHTNVINCILEKGAD